jgi:hypothetical protein
VGSQVVVTRGRGVRIVLAAQRLVYSFQRFQLLNGLVLGPHQRIVRSIHGIHAADDLVELQMDRQRITALGVWIRKTIRKVTMVVPVLMTSCQVSEKPKSGPVTAHTRMTATAARKLTEWPANAEVRVAKSANQRPRGLLLSLCGRTHRTPGWQGFKRLTIRIRGGS